MSSNFSLPFTVFYTTKAVDRNTSGSISIGKWREDWLFPWDLWLSTALTAVRPWLSSSWNLMQSESLKCFRFIGNPCAWEHNCGKLSLASFLSLFYLQTNYPIQGLHIHSTAMIGLIPRNHFEQPGNLIPFGNHLHIVTSFLNWVPNEWEVYEMGPKKPSFQVMLVVICQLFADKKHGSKFYNFKLY